MRCKNCGAEMVGDGNTTVLHCVNAENHDSCEPDANPVFCMTLEQWNELYIEDDLDAKMFLNVDLD